MISFRIPGGSEVSSRFCKALRLAERLGGVDSLCDIPAMMTHKGMRVVGEKGEICDDLMTLSVGVEGVEDLNGFGASFGESRL